MTHTETDHAPESSEIGKELEAIAGRAEQFFHEIRRQMTIGLVTAKFLREQLTLVDPQWETRNGDKFMLDYWGERCEVDQPGCACCDAWHQYDYRCQLFQAKEGSEVLEHELVWRDTVEQES